MTGERETNVPKPDALGKQEIKVNQSSLWEEHERAFLDDVTMNLIPDDEAMNVKGKTVMKWDKVKKRYVL